MYGYPMMPPPTPQLSDHDILTRAFVTARSSRSLVNTGAALPLVEDIDIRDMAPVNRHELSKGDMFQIYIGENMIIETTRAVFNVTSTKANEILLNGMVKLREDVEPGGVIHLIRYLHAMVHSYTASARMSIKDMAVFHMLSVTSAAEKLGMDKYTDHVYKKCEAVFRNELLSYEDLDNAIDFALDHPRLFRLVAKNLAVHIWEDTIPDPEEFQAYLDNHPVLNEQVKDVIKLREAEIRVAQERVGSRQQMERDARDRQFWEGQKRMAASLEQACLAKSRLPMNERKVFTAQEKAHWRKTRGQQPPKGC